MAIHVLKAIDLLDRQIEWTKEQLPAEQSAAQSPAKLHWQGGPMELVELVYALHEAGCFGDAPLKTVFEVFGKTFDCEITNYYRLF
ncbi:MAG: RteC domain-containing protein, partial [Prevotellaceae bacterium]|nr:RteC domain-containing protein [Prevotellaceae bacterium]